MGGSRERQKTPIAPETGLEPHFHVTHVMHEVASDGTVMIYCYEERRGELRLQYTATMMPSNLISAARAASIIAADAHNMREFLKVFGETNGTH